jgi:hypothetical protein
MLFNNNLKMLDIKNTKKDEGIREDFNNVVSENNIKSLWINYDSNPHPEGVFWSCILKFKKNNTTVEKYFKFKSYKILMEKVYNFITTHK